MVEIASGRLAVLFGASALISAGLLWALHPLLKRYALARPNARSSHRAPTPQGGGIAVVAATIVGAAGVFVLTPDVFDQPLRIAVIFAGAVALAAVGAIDDVRPLGIWPRLLLQAIAVIVVLAALPAALRVVPWLPLWVERALIFVGVLWFVNLVNFMDGIDWITVAETVPLTAALVLFAAMGALPRDAGLVAVALCGAMVGFAPFNRPVARVFLGDVGSLPVGLLLAWMLVLLAGGGHLAAAALLPLYYLADATVTLLRRLANGEAVTQAHRSHFYQRATDKFTVMQVVGQVVALNLVLAALALATLLMPSPLVHAAALLTGGVLVAALLYRFAKA